MLSTYLAFAFFITQKNVDLPDIHFYKTRISLNWVFWVFSLYQLTIISAISPPYPIDPKHPASFFTTKGL